VIHLLSSTSGLQNRGIIGYGIHCAQMASHLNHANHALEAAHHPGRQVLHNEADDPLPNIHYQTVNLNELTQRTNIFD
jgi:hypothetical protein